MEKSFISLSPGHDLTGPAPRRAPGLTSSCSPRSPDKEFRSWVGLTGILGCDRRPTAWHAAPSVYKDA